MDLYDLEVNEDITEDAKPDVTCKTNFIWRDSEEDIISEITEDELNSKDLSPSNFALQPGFYLS